MTIKVNRINGESRKDYLLRVCLAYLEMLDEGPYVKGLDETVEYDGAECDGLCLIDDLRNEIEYGS